VVSYLNFLDFFLVWRRACCNCWCCWWYHEIIWPTGNETYERCKLCSIYSQIQLMMITHPCTEFVLTNLDVILHIYILNAVLSW